MGFGSMAIFQLSIVCGVSFFSCVFRFSVFLKNKLFFHVFFSFLFFEFVFLVQVFFPFVFSALSADSKDVLEFLFLFFCVLMDSFSLFFCNQYAVRCTLHFAQQQLYIAKQQYKQCVYYTYCCCSSI